MNVIVDTDVWSEALRKKGPKSAYVGELNSLIEEGRVELVGVVRMEILCGIRSLEAFELVRERLTAFPDRTLDAGISVMAAQFFNLCRGKGVQGSNNDFILCACSAKWKLPILTKDKDFLAFRRLVPIDLAQPRGR